MRLLLSKRLVGLVSSRPVVTRWKADWGRDFGAVNEERSRGVVKTTRFDGMPVVASSFHTVSFLGKAFSSPQFSEHEPPPSTDLLDSIKERGLYHEEMYRHWRHHKVKDLTLADDGKLCNIVWEDGHKSSFHAVWLRHNCLCPSCRLTHNNMVDLDEMDVDLRVGNATMEGDEVIEFTWTDKDGNVIHTGHTLTSLLRKGCYSKENIEAKYKQRAMTFHKDKIIPELDYTELMASERGLYKWLKHISERGLCLLRNVPLVDKKSKEIALLIGKLYLGVYDKVFLVKSHADPIDAAYTTERLYHHMDQIQQECPPGIQFLHCLKFDECIQGGENHFVDAHEVAHEFREKHPDMFDTLCRVPYSPQTIDYDREYQVQMYFQRPIFSLNHRGDLINVSYHPTMQGPLAVPHEDVIPFYKAFLTFAKMFNHNPSPYQLRLRPGDLIAFNNRRVTHSRTAFDTSGERHLQGTYVDSSQFQNRLQVLRSKYEDGDLVTHCGGMDFQ